MSEAEDKLKDDEAIIEFESGPKDPGDSRRLKGDRRVIKRFSDKRVYGHFKQTQIWIKVITGLLVGWGIYLVYQNAMKGEAGIGEGIFWTVLIGMSVIPLLRYHKAITFYLGNESVNNLEKCVERQLNLIMVMAFVSVLYTIVVNV